MNISLQSKAVTVYVQKKRQQFLEIWHTFSLTPALYWKPTLLLFVVLLVAVLMTDAFIFWRYFITLDRDIPATSTRSLTLENEMLESALKLLRTREEQFLNAEQGVTFRNIFVSPQSPQQP